MNQTGISSPRILIGGYLHETNTFAPTKADWAAFKIGNLAPAYLRGDAMLQNMRGVNFASAGFIKSAERQGWTLVPSAWAGASPSSYMTRDAFERISAAILEDILTAQASGLDGIYLDLHGAAMAEHVDDSEGELLFRIRAVVGDALPIVVSLDLHANVTQRMLALADGIVACRTYPHVDMVETGERAAQLLDQRLHTGVKASMATQRLPFLIPLNAQNTQRSPARDIYEELAVIEGETGTTLSFCMGFPASDFDECGPVLWGHGAAAEAAVQRLYQRASPPEPWRFEALPALEAVRQALVFASQSHQPVVVADTQDNPGAGGDGNTTGMLHALLQSGAGRAHPGRVALGLLRDPDAARQAHEAGVGAVLELSLGRAVPTFCGDLSDEPVQGRFTVRALGPAVCEIKGRMLTGVKANLGLSACLEHEGVLIAVVTNKMQLLDQEQFRVFGIVPKEMKVMVVKSSNHFREDFAPIAGCILIAKAAGPVAADPGDLPWRKLSPLTRTRP